MLRRCNRARNTRSTTGRPRERRRDIGKVNKVSTKCESASDKWQLQVSSRYASHANHYSCYLPPPTRLPTRRLAYIRKYVHARAWAQPCLRRIDTSFEMSTVLRAPASQRLCSHARVPLPFVYTRQAERSVRHTPLAQDSREPTSSLH